MKSFKLFFLPSLTEKFKNGPKRASYPRRCDAFLWGRAQPAWRPQGWARSAAAGLGAAAHGGGGVTDARGHQALVAAGLGGRHQELLALGHLDELGSAAAAVAVVTVVAGGGQAAAAAAGQTAAAGGGGGDTATTAAGQTAAAARGGLGQAAAAAAGESAAAGGGGGRRQGQLDGHGGHGELGAAAAGARAAATPVERGSLGTESRPWSAQQQQGQRK